MASHTLALSRTISRRNPLGRYRPQRFGAPSRWRFIRDRRAGYLARVSGAPTDWQAATIESLIALEWSALLDEAADTPQGRREAREHRRLFARLLADFERSRAPAPAERGPSLAEYLATKSAAAA